MSPLKTNFETINVKDTKRRSRRSTKAQNWVVSCSCSATNMLLDHIFSTYCYPSSGGKE